ncbi:MAG: RHS repeat domain-containing protein, partial [Armatimonadota bacterium]
MHKRKAVQLLMVLPLLAMICLTSSVWASVPDWMSRNGTILNARLLPDGSHVYLDAEDIVKIKTSASTPYILVAEAFSQKDRLIVLTDPSPLLRLGQLVDIEGDLTTLPSGDRAIENVTVWGYTDKNGVLLTRGGPLCKGIPQATPWSYKVDLTIRSTRGTAVTSEVTSSEAPNTTPAEGPTRYSRIADVLNAESTQVQGVHTQSYYDEIPDVLGLSDGSLVELQCKGITATGTETINGTIYNYLDLIENPPATDTIRAYYSGTVAATSRVNRITGQIRHTDPNTPVIDVDTGPGGYDPQILEGSLQTVAQGTIAWAKTFPDGTQVSVQLSGKVASASFPGSGFFFMQEAGIGSGIRVDTSLQTWPQPGQEVSIDSYEVSTSDSQRILTASANDITLGTLVTVAPIGINNRSMAGGAFNVLTPGATGAFGLNNIGLLVRTWGRTTDVQSNYLYITDGSDDLGVKVDLTQGGGNPISHNLQVGDYAAITGISLLESSGSDLVRVIKPRNSSDLNQMFRDTTAPNPGTASSPGFTSSSPVVVTYSGASDSGIGLKKVELWYKKGIYGGWTNSSQSETHSSGSFSFALDGEETYYFDLVAEDYAGNRSAAASGDGDCHTIYEIALSASGRAFAHNQYLYPGGPLIRSTAHDETGNQVREVTQTYGSEGELLGRAGSTDPATYQYDAAYRVKTILDGKSQATNYFYDNVGNLTSIVYPGDASVQFPEHDPVGNVL